jgi:hypothetical protein
LLTLLVVKVDNTDKMKWFYMTGEQVLKGFSTA